MPGVELPVVGTAGVAVVPEVVPKLTTTDAVPVLIRPTKLFSTFVLGLISRGVDADDGTVMRYVGPLGLKLGSISVPLFLRNYRL